MTAIVVLGMHRSGTSCLAGMLAAGGLASAGDAVRNWDNARGHHEMLDIVRLDEAVLAYSGGHYLSPAASLRWTDEHADARDRLLRARIGGRPALLKDPRMLLVLPFWRASSVPFHAVGIVRHPLAVARSLESWRELPVAEGIALWTAHNRALVEDRDRHGYPILDFEQPKSAIVASVLEACAPFAGTIDAGALSAVYDQQLVHHDVTDAPVLTGLDEAVTLYRRLAGIERRGKPERRPVFPREQLAAFEARLREGDTAVALASARAALASIADTAAVLVPVVVRLARHHAYREARQLVAEQAPRLDDGLADLLHGKLLLAMGDAACAAQHLEAACAVPRAFFQARHLLPQALRAAGRHAEARAAMRRVASEALYPHGPLATLAEWSWLDGARAEALAEMQHAIAAAPRRRRGRLRTRRAEWLFANGDASAARTELLLAIDEDPGYQRSRDVLARLA